MVSSMGYLDGKSYAAKIVGCAKCDRKAFEVASYIERELQVMIGEPSQDGRWIHDEEKFIDGTYRIRCLGCGDEAYASDDCPSCKHTVGLTEALAAPSRLAIPRMCPECKTTSLTVTAAVPARVRTGEGQVTAPTQIARFGEPGFHVTSIACEGCDWTAKPSGCAICGHSI